MRAVVQRVASASVTIANRPVAAIGRGLLVYLGVGVGDHDDDARALAAKIASLRVFPDDERRLNRDVSQAGGEVLVVSAFTVMADARRGRRPTLEAALRGDRAESIYLAFCAGLSTAGLRVACGVFGADMRVDSVNDGPVCVLLDSQKSF